MESRSLRKEGKGGKIIIYSEIGAYSGEGWTREESHQSFIHGTEFEVMNESCAIRRLSLNAPSILIEDVLRNSPRSTRNFQSSDGYYLTS